MNNKNKTTAIAYLGIIAVVIVWGLIPSAKKALIGDSFSSSVYNTVTAFSAACVLLVISWKKIKELDRSCFKIAVPTGLCLGMASLMQALAYNFDASPTKQAFLENLSCVIVPVILFLLIKKRPHPLTIAASVVCLVSSMVLAGVFTEGIRFHTADILNALAGILYGVNIALTGVYAKKQIPQLYVMIQLFINTLFSAAMAIAFNFIRIDGSPIDPFVFSPDIWLILALICLGILTNAVCWTIRTTAMKYVSANAVAVIMPLSAVITGIFSVVIGQDKLTVSLVIGAALGFAAGLMSSAGDIMEKKKEKEEL